MRAAQRSPIFVRIARRSNQERAETSTAIKLAAAETEHAKTMMTNTIYRAARVRHESERQAPADLRAKERRAMETQAADRASERRKLTANCASACHHSRILCVYFVPALISRPFSPLSTVKTISLRTMQTRCQLGAILLRHKWYIRW